MAVKAVREISPLSLGSGVRLRELIQLPEWLIVAGKVLAAIVGVTMWLCVHYVITGTVAMFILGWIQFGAWWAGLLVAWIVPAAYWMGRVAFLLRASEATTVSAALYGMRRAYKIQQLWHSVMHELKITSRSNGAVPPLKYLLPTDTGLVGTVITGKVALPSAKLVKLESELASGLFCDRVTVRSLSPSIATIRFDWGQHLRKRYFLQDLPPLGPQPADKPAKIRFGVRADGQPATLVSNLSTLIGGLSGGGKSSAIWAIIAGYLETVPVRVRIVDLSGAEFQAARDNVGNGFIHDYAGNQYVPGARKIKDFWEDLEQAFNQRMAVLEKSGKRWHQPTPQEPLDLLIIDEILPISAQLKKDSTEHIVGRICFLGRKAGFAVIAAAQAGQVDTLGRIRDLFPQRLAFHTANRYLTDAFLGDGAESDGARASQLDIDQDQGVGYMAAGGVRGYTSFRSAWVPNSAAEQIARGMRPLAVDLSALKSKPTSLYRLYGGDNTLLYVGIAEATRVDHRWAEHARSKTWWSDVARKEVYHTWPDRDGAETAEAMMIKRLKPVHNKQHNENRVAVPAQRGRSE